MSNALNIASIVISSIALLISVPSGILAVINITKSRVSISLSAACLAIYKNANKYKLRGDYRLVNHSPISFTILKIDAIYYLNNSYKTSELFIDTVNGQSIFNNVSVTGSSAQNYEFAFYIDAPIQNSFKVKIYTNTKIIKKTIYLSPNLSHQEGSW